MKIKLRRRFIYTWDQRNEHTLEPGLYEVPRQVDKKTAELAISFGAAVVVPEPKPEPKKKAPEDKVQKAVETK